MLEQTKQKTARQKPASSLAESIALRHTIIALRKHEGMNQIALAQLMAQDSTLITITQSVMSLLEKGHSQITLSHLQIYSRALNVPLSAIMLFAKTLQSPPEVLEHFDLSAALEIMAELEKSPKRMRRYFNDFIEGEAFADAYENAQREIQG